MTIRKVTEWIAQCDVCGEYFKYYPAKLMWRFVTPEAGVRKLTEAGWNVRKLTGVKSSHIVMCPKCKVDDGEEQTNS